MIISLAKRTIAWIGGADLRARVKGCTFAGLLIMMLAKISW